VYTFSATNAIGMPRKDQSEIPSGSNWGGDELDRFHFEQSTRQSNLKDFPWKELFTTEDFDPIKDISQCIEDLFGAEAEAGKSLRAKETSNFFSTLDLLKGRRRALGTVDLSRTRSKGALYSSSPIAYTDKDPAESVGSAFPAFGPSLGRSEEHTLTSQELHETSSPWIEEAEHITEPDLETPSKRRKKRKGMEEHLVQSPLKSVNEDFEQEGDRSTLPTNEIESNYTQDQGFEDYLYLGSPTQQQYPQNPVENPPGVLFVDQHFPSSQSDSTYQGAREESQDLLIPSTPNFKQDQEETTTNMLMLLLLQNICSTITEQTDNSGIKLTPTPDGDVLKVPVDGQFPTSKPDLKITLQRNRTNLTILDYEASPIGLCAMNPLMIMLTKC
jgi:hypothetical protein